MNHTKEFRILADNYTKAYAAHKAAVGIHSEFITKANANRTPKGRYRKSDNEVLTLLGARLDDTSSALSNAKTPFIEALIEKQLSDSQQVKFRISSLIEAVNHAVPLNVVCSDVRKRQLEHMRSLCNDCSRQHYEEAIEAIDSRKVIYFDITNDVASYIGMNADNAKDDGEPLKAVLKVNFNGLGYLWSADITITKGEWEYAESSRGARYEHFTQQVRTDLDNERLNYCAYGSASDTFTAFDGASRIVASRIHSIFRDAAEKRRAYYNGIHDNDALLEIASKIVVDGDV